jgi:hypothetical protein
VHVEEPNERAVVHVNVLLLLLVLVLMLVIAEENQRFLDSARNDKGHHGNLRPPENGFAGVDAG